MSNATAILGTAQKWELGTCWSISGTRRVKKDSTPCTGVTTIRPMPVSWSLMQLARLEIGLLGNSQPGVQTDIWDSPPSGDLQKPEYLVHRTAPVSTRNSNAAWCQQNRREHGGGPPIWIWLKDLPGECFVWTYCQVFYRTQVSLGSDLWIRFSH